MPFLCASRHLLHSCAPSLSEGLVAAHIVVLQPLGTKAGILGADVADPPLGTKAETIGADVVM